MTIEFGRCPVLWVNGNGSGLVRSLVFTAANVADVTQADKLLGGEEGVAYGYAGVEKREELEGR